jgi:hypothetical protein
LAAPIETSPELDGEDAQVRAANRLEINGEQHSAVGSLIM